MRRLQAGTSVKNLKINTNGAALEILTAGERGVFMRIVSLNCNGKFRAKFQEIAKLCTGIRVIQECENPD